MYSKPDSTALVGAHWMKVGTPTRSMARTMPIVVSMLVVLNAPATRCRKVHSAMTSCPLTKGMIGFLSVRTVSAARLVWTDRTSLSFGEAMAESAHACRPGVCAFNTRVVSRQSNQGIDRRRRHSTYFSCPSSMACMYSTGGIRMPPGPKKGYE